MMNEESFIKNPALLEIYKLLFSLYLKKAVTQKELKEFSFNLKQVTNKLPETQEIYLQ